jgi:hypothetical protein
MGKWLANGHGYRTAMGYWTLSQDRNRAVFRYWTSQRNRIASEPRCSLVTPRRNRHSATNTNNHYDDTKRTHDAHTTPTHRNRPPNANADRNRTINTTTHRNRPSDADDDRNERVPAGVDVDVPARERHIYDCSANKFVLSRDGSCYEGYKDFASGDGIEYADGCVSE